MTDRALECVEDEGEDLEQDREASSGEEETFLTARR